MKIEFLVCYLLCLICVLACAKPICPEPVSITTPIIPPITPTVDTTTQPAKPQRYVVTLQPGSESKDALLNNTAPSQNFPDKTYLHCRAWTVNGVISLEKAIIQFDYSAIPSGAVITKAIVTFFADTTQNTGSLGHSQLTGSNDWVLKRITQAWEETTVTGDTEPSTDLSIQCAASTSASQAYEIELTSWVADEIAHPTSYYGFLMEMNSDTPYRAISFYSSDCQYPTLRPKMVIEYMK